MHRPLSRSAARAAVLTTALVATVALGGGAAALQGAGTPTPAPTPSASATPFEAAQEQRSDAPHEVEESPGADERTDTGTQRDVDEASPPAEGPKTGQGPKPGKGPKAGKGPERAGGPVPEVAFTCDPSKSHGQNVSAYVHSLPKGQGRGRQVSQVAKSDCGKTR